MNKRCFKCGEGKPLHEFYPHPMMRDGHLNKCKDCAKRDVREHHRKRRTDAVYLAKQRARGREKHQRLYAGRPSTAKQRAYARKAHRRWAAKNEHKRNAQGAVANAIARGDLVRPERCQDCGLDGTIHGHHEDYSKPLDVDWLCVACHGKRHRKAA